MPLLASNHTLSMKIFERFIGIMLHVRFRELLADYNSDSLQNQGQLRAPLKADGSKKKSKSEKPAKSTFVTT